MSTVTEEYAGLAAQLRIDSIRSTTKAGSGHPTSSMSAADLMAVLLKTYLKYDSSTPHAPTNDHLIFSKGHAAPLLYAMYRAAGWITDEEQMSLRKFGSIIEGHPVPLLPYVDVATGSLGQGLPIGVGIAWVGKNIDKLPYRVWVLLGDSEVAEGSIWEAFDKSSHYKLNNLIAILDMNRLGQRGETDLGWDSAAYAARASAFGAHTIEIDGHDLEQIVAAYEEALTVIDKPVMIIAKTEKGHGYTKIANQPGWHGKALPQDMADEAIAILGGEQTILIEVHKPEPGSPAAAAATTPLELPKYELGTKEAARKAYGDALVSLGASNANILVTDAEVSNSTYAEEFGHKYPERFLEVFIAEQQLLGAVVGFSVRGKIGFASTFAAFFSRAFDQIRMAAISRANIRLAGSHAGISIGEDGPSQMALEDLAMLRSVFGSTVLYPSDANQTAHLTALMAETSGISYIRTTREKLPVIYSPDEKFVIGGSKVVRESDGDQITVVGAGITLHEAIKAADQLAGEGIKVRVIDLYSIKPVDKATLRAAAAVTNTIVTVEDHWPEGGVGDAVIEAFEGEFNSPRIVKLAVTKIPGSGKPAELLGEAGIDAAGIARTVKSLIG